MSEYLRASRECGLDSIDRNMAAAIRAHLEKHDTGEIQAQANERSGWSKLLSLSPAAGNVH